MSASVLCLRALRRPTWTHQEIDEPRSTAPYRVPRTGEPPGPRPAILGFTRAKRDSMHRLLVGSLCCVYLSAWTSGWSGGSLLVSWLLRKVATSAGDRPPSDRGRAAG